MNKVSILIVEDNPAHAIVLKKILKKGGNLVLGVARSGKEVFALFQKRIPDLILMDIELEDNKDGMDTAEMIHHVYKMPIVFISQYPHSEDILKARWREPFIFLPKPVCEHSLMEAIADVTRQLKIDSPRKIGEKHYKMLTQYSPDIICLTDIETTHKIYINKDNIFGYTKAEFYDLPHKAFFATDDLPKFNTYTEHILRSQGVEPPSVELQVIAKDGSPRWISLRQAVIDRYYGSQGEVMMSVLTDITERKRAELELIKTNFELDNFIYRASHDLRSPMKTILGLVNVIKMESDPARQIQYLDLITHSVQKLDNYIFDMTNYSRNSKMEMEYEKINFNEIYENQLEFLHEKEGFEKLAKTFCVNQAVDFVSDPLRISIVFGNLLSNAVKFQNFASSSSFLKVSVLVQEEFVSITFEDNGIGIDPQLRPRIFDMFYRAVGHPDGSGLGLYVVKQIITKLGGNIEVFSTLGHGSTFRITIPNRIKHF